MAKKPKVTEEQMFGDVQVALARLGNWKLVIFAVGVPLSLLALALPVSEVAGRDTKIDANIAVSFSIVTGVAGAAAESGRRKAKKRVKELTRRNQSLEQDVTTARDELKAATLRASSLESDLKGVRADLDRLRLQ